MSRWSRVSRIQTAFCSHQKQRKFVNVVVKSFWQGNSDFDCAIGIVTLFHIHQLRKTFNRIRIEIVEEIFSTGKDQNHTVSRKKWRIVLDFTELMTWFTIFRMVSCPKSVEKVWPSMRPINSWLEVELPGSSAYSMAGVKSLPTSICTVPDKQLHLLWRINFCKMALVVSDSKW